MSRLEQHEKKQSSQRFLIGLVLAIAAIMLFFNVGLKMLVSFTLFLNQLANGNTSSQEMKQQEILSRVTIDPIASATSSSTIAFSGTSLSFDTLEIYLNDEKQDEIDISDTFEGEVQGLEKGDNTVHFIAKSSKMKKTEKTQSYSVSFIDEKPKLDISEPSENSKVNKEDVKISGKTDKEVEIRINSIPVVVDAEGSFTTTYRLKEGENKIEISATNIVGIEEKKTISVTYAKDD